MSIEEIILKLENLERRTHAKNAGLPDGWPLDEQVLADEATLHEAIGLLKTHPDAQPNEPLTPEELKGMKWEPAWVDGSCEMELGGKRGWAILYHEPIKKYITVWWPCAEYADIPSLDYYGDTWKVYRRPPREDAP